MKKLNISQLAGLGLLIFAAIWQFGLRNNFNQRFPDGWEWIFDSIGNGSFPMSETGFPEGTTLVDDPLIISQRRVTADTDSAPSGLVHITDHYETYDPVTNAITWELTLEANVDPFTGQYLDGESAGSYYFLPRNVDKNTTYPISNTTYRNLPMSFQREEVVNGINSYLFAYYGDFNNEAAYPDIPLEENQAIICFDVELEYWVEPITGEMLKMREWCEGDYLVDTTTNQRLIAIQRWGTEPTGDDLLRRSGEVQGILLKYQIINVYLPAGLTILGIILLGLGLIPMFGSNKPKAAETI